MWLSTVGRRIGWFACIIACMSACIAGLPLLYDFRPGAAPLPPRPLKRARLRRTPARDRGECPEADLDPNRLPPWLLNWEDVAADLLQSVRREAMGDGPGSEATRLLDALTALPGIHAAARQPNLERAALPFLPMMLRKDGVEPDLFTTIATLGTPHDVTVHELRLESFFPADEAGRQWFHDAA